MMEIAFLFFWNRRLFFGTDAWVAHFLPTVLETGGFEVPRRVDKERLERADREAKLVLDAERHARDAKTTRLREQRLRQEASADKSPPARRREPVRKPVRRVIEVD
ncbi:hypothetical protein C7I87_12755 [Mesorhizobium sp. SARCC-RB16n]|nr:hypothetical protein C7I87_12755 [Mesorhizobium sp. SARCC-RB16n]